MPAIHLIATVLICVFSGAILIGLFYKPWVVLWWMDRQNRLMVLQYYGSALLVSFLVKYLTATG